MVGLFRFFSCSTGVNPFSSGLVDQLFQSASNQAVGVGRVVALSLASSSADGHAPARDIVLCSYFTLTVPLHPGVQMGSGELNARGNPGLTSHPGASRNIASSNRNQNKLQPDEPLGLYVDFTFTNQARVVRKPVSINLGLKYMFTEAVCFLV